MIWKWLLRRIMTFICRPASVDIWYIHWTFIKKKTTNKHRRNLMSTLEFRDLLDGISEACSMIVYFYLWNLTWINIWRNYEVLRLELGKFIVTIFFYLWRLPCAAVFLFPILEFRYIECFAYTSASLIFNIFLCLNMYPSLIVSPCFFSVLPLLFLPSPPHLQGPVIVCAVFASLPFVNLLVVPSCSKVVVMALIFTDRLDISFFLFTF